MQVAGIRVAVHPLSVVAFDQQPRLAVVILVSSVQITRKPEYAGPSLIFTTPLALAVAENFGTEGLHTYFSVIRLLLVSVSISDGYKVSTVEMSCSCERLRTKQVVSSHGSVSGQLV